jgi:hypothetical protein
MAWNPTPEVQVARDAAKALTKSGRFIDRCVILFTTEQGEMGYASYGKDSRHCGEARRIADAAYEHVASMFEKIEDAHGSSRPTGGENVPWNDIVAETTAKIGLLRDSLAAFPADQSDARRMYMRDLVLPAMELLARFCSCVNIEEPQPMEGER